MKPATFLMAQACATAVASLAFVGFAHAQTAPGYIQAGKLYVQAGNPAGQEIVELRAVWDESPQGNTNYWESSPDLRQTPYSVPANAKAVLIQLKAKVVTKRWSEAHCEGTIQLAVRSPVNAAPVNAVSYAHAAKPSGFGASDVDGGLVAEDLNYNTTVVPIVDGRFEIFTDRYLRANVEVSRVVFLVGYYSTR